MCDHAGTAEAQGFADCSPPCHADPRFAGDSQRSKPNPGSGVQPGGLELWHSVRGVPAGALHEQDRAHGSPGQLTADQTTRLRFGGRLDGSKCLPDRAQFDRLARAGTNAQRIARASIAS